VATDIHLSVGFATEMPCGWARGGSQIPLNDRELLIRALDHKPMWAIGTLVGVSMIISGFTRVMFSLAVRKVAAVGS